MLRWDRWIFHDFLNLSTPTPLHNQPIPLSTLKVALFIIHSQHNHIKNTHTHHHHSLPILDSTELGQRRLVHKQVSCGPIRVSNERHRSVSTQQFVDAVDVVKLRDYVVVLRGWNTCAFESVSELQVQRVSDRFGYGETVRVPLPVPRLSSRSFRSRIVRARPTRIIPVAPPFVVRNHQRILLPFRARERKSVRTAYLIYQYSFSFL